MSELHKKLGLAFKAEREQRKIDIDQISDELKISVDKLTAIENGDAEFLPSELYYKLFTKTYAEHLGIDLIATIEAIKEDLGISFDSDISKNSETSNSPDETDDSENSYQSSSDDHNAVAEQIISIAAGLTVLIGIIFGIYALTSGEIIGSSSSSDNEAHEGFTSDFAEYRSMLANYEWDMLAKTETKPLRFTISSLDDSWATVLADGDTAIYWTIVPGQDYTAEAKYRFLITVGIPSRVTIKINGREVNLRDSVSRRISRVEVNQVNKEKFPPGIPARKKSTAITPSANIDSSKSRAGER